MSLKGLCIVCVVIASAHPTAAQVYGGAKLNYTLSFSRPEIIKYDDALDFLTYKMTYIEQDVSPGFSAFLRWRKDLVFLQAEAGYRHVRTRFLSENFIEAPDHLPVETVKETSYMRVPLTAGLNADRFYFGLGPVFGFILSENRIFEEIENFEERRRRIDSGFQFSFAVTLHRLQLDLAYEYQFNGVADYLYYRKDHKSFSRQSRLINLGMSFLF